ncbi:MAG: hypothetical protein HY593_05180 [Candidatus Omnitrophica bacterium]|nr:hypothetical protein [Candidatus Omnitrophota bacterium]
MPRRIITKPRFERAYQALSSSAQEAVDAALRQFGHYLKIGAAPVGFGMKHLGKGVYEFRAGLALRIVYIVEEDEIVLSLLGTHDEVRRFLKRR